MLSAMPAAFRHRDEDLAQERCETHDERNHREDEKNCHQTRGLERDQCADERARDDEADQERSAVTAAKIA